MVRADRVVDRRNPQKEDAEEQHICTAGGIQSFIGSASTEDKERLLNIVGEKAFELATLFNQNKLNFQSTEASAIRKAIALNQKIRHDYKNLVIK